MVCVALNWLFFYDLCCLIFCTPWPLPYPKWPLLHSSAVFLDIFSSHLLTSMTFVAPSVLLQALNYPHLLSSITSVALICSPSWPMWSSSEGPSWHLLPSSVVLQDLYCLNCDPPLWSSPIVLCEHCLSSGLCWSQLLCSMTSVSSGLYTWPHLLSSVTSVSPMTTVSPMASVDLTCYPPWPLSLPMPLLTLRFHIWMACLPAVSF